MADPHVREIGRVHDLDGIPVTVGVDYDSVTIGTGGKVRLPQEEAEAFAQLFVAACWEAASGESSDGGDGA